MYDYLIAFGGNVGSTHGNPPETMQAALQTVVERGLRIVDQSRIFRSASFPDPTGPEYANGVFWLRDEREPEDVLSILHGIEADFGRERVSRWGERIVDLDILSCDDLVRPDLKTWRDWRDLPFERQTQETPDRLILPHPRLQDRAFVLVPLMDIAPDWCHPVTGHTVRQMHADLPEKLRNDVKPL